MSDHTHVRPWRHIERRKSRQIRVGSVPVGGDAPDQRPVDDQYADPRRGGDDRPDPQLEEAGADIVRVSCPDVESTAAFKTIAREAKVPLVADIHFHYKRGIEAAEAGAACLRINPGNIGSSPTASAT
jgi:(E)-4-hydroxy-3-methylbut-2-enyl-diphosphate synthase